jgi:hypothetical protein
MKLRSVLISLSKRHCQIYCIFVAKVLIARSSLRIHILIFLWLVHRVRFVYTPVKVHRIGKSGIRTCLHLKRLRKDTQEPSAASAAIRT